MPANPARKQTRQEGTVGSYLRAKLGHREYQKLLDRSYGFARREQRKAKRATAGR